MKSPIHCKRGHPWNETNTRWHSSKTGKPFRVCRKCKAFLQKLRYRTNADYYETHKARARERYYRRVRQDRAGNAGACEQPLGGGQ